MAEKEGQVTLAGKSLKSLVSYGVSYEDDEDDERDGDTDGEPMEDSTSKLSRTVSAATTASILGKRRMEEPSSTDEPPQQKKKFFMPFGSASSGAKVSPAPTLGPGTAGVFMKMGSSKSTTVHNKSSSIGKKSSGSKPQAIKLSLSTQNKVQDSISSNLAARKSLAVARAFEEEDSDESEDMPADARMRMRNIGRETPTAAGPNSFGKNRLGFCDRQKMLERELEKEVGSSDKCKK